jgi:hypothetical protein
LFQGEAVYEQFELKDNLNSLEDLLNVLDELADIPAPLDQNSVDFVIWSLTRPKPAHRMSLSRALTIIEENLKKV